MRMLFRVLFCLAAIGLGLVGTATPSYAVPYCATAAGISVESTSIIPGFYDGTGFGSTSCQEVVGSTINVVVTSTHAGNPSASEQPCLAAYCATHTAPSTATTVLLGNCWTARAQGVGLGAGAKVTSNDSATKCVGILERPKV